jgi:hypothetical protein
MTTTSETTERVRRILDDMGRDPRWLRERGEAHAEALKAKAIRRQMGVTGAMAASDEWLSSFGAGVFCAQLPIVRLLLVVVGHEASDLVAERFAFHVNAEVPSAWLLGFKDELGRIQRRLR